MCAFECELSEGKETEKRTLKSIHSSDRMLTRNMKMKTINTGYVCLMHASENKEQQPSYSMCRLNKITFEIMDFVRLLLRILILKAD